MSASSSFRFGACAPSNIALIKYMGKKEGSANLPENGSLSMTLRNLCTFAEVELREGVGGNRWVSELPRLSVVDSFVRENPGLRPIIPVLKGEGLSKVHRHLERVRSECDGIFKEFGLESRRGEFELVLRTANTFPQGSGIASSASSFAAITLAAAAACTTHPLGFERVYNSETGFRRRLARLSRMGSGSSCRSFEGHWVRWNEERTEAVTSACADLAHFVLVASEQEKRVSSSQAHARVKASPLWDGRVERAEARLTALQKALERGDWASVSKIAWSESWEMHSLFHTSAEPFSYWEAETVDALQFLASFIGTADGPVVTLDAGPNVHLIVPAQSSQVWSVRLRERFPKMRLLEDRPGTGAVCWLEALV